MDRLAQYLRKYAEQRCASHPGWRSLKVILSDAGMPGEVNPYHTRLAGQGRATREWLGIWLGLAAMMSKNNL